MTKNIRLIPRLDIKGPNLVKGIHLEGLRVLGDPAQFAREYYRQGADELVYMDVVASLYNRNSLHEMIRATAQEALIPMTVGGGLRSIEDVREVLRAGADKVSLNTAAVKNPQLVREASRKFGSSTVVVSIEAIRHDDGRYYAYTDNGREQTGLEVLSWAKQVEALGAGEILLTSIDREGTGRGFDVELTRMVASELGIPVIACGGAGQSSHVVDVVTQGLADAVAIASIVHYGIIERQSRSAATPSAEGNRAFLASGRAFSKVQPTSLRDIKDAMRGAGVACRLEAGLSLEER